MLSHFEKGSSTTGAFSKLTSECVADSFSCTACGRYTVAYCSSCWKILLGDVHCCDSTIIWTKMETWLKRFVTQIFLVEAHVMWSGEKRSLTCRLQQKYFPFNEDVMQYSTQYSFLGFDIQIDTDHKTKVSQTTPEEITTYFRNTVNALWKILRDFCFKSADGALVLQSSGV